MNTFFQFAFASFWQFVGCLIMLCVVVFMAGNLTWRLAYLVAVMLRGWPENAPKSPGFDQNIQL